MCIVFTCVLGVAACCVLRAACVRQIVERTGRGLIQSVACGREFTLVVTQPYEGPSEATAKEIIEEEDIRLEELAIRERQMARRKRNQMADKQEKVKKEMTFEAEVKQFKCDLDPTCPGFERHVFKPNICKECGYNKSHHNTPMDEKGADGEIEEEAMFA